MTRIKLLHHINRSKLADEIYTPVEAITPLFDYLDNNKVYYEATSNISNKIINVFRSNGYNIIGSEGRDFLKDNIPNNIDIIITNPPYSIKDKFLKRAYDIGKPFCFLLPVSSLQGQYRGKLFQKYGIELLVLNRRIDFTGKKSPHFGVAWFCHKVLQDKLIFYNNSKYRRKNK